MHTFWNRRRRRRRRRKRNKSDKKELNQRLIKDRIIGDIRALFEQEEKDYYKPERVNNFWNNNFIEYESNGDKNKNLSLDKYLGKIEHYWRDTIIDLQHSNTWHGKFS